MKQDLEKFNLLIRKLPKSKQSAALGKDMKAFSASEEEANRYNTEAMRLISIIQNLNWASDEDMHKVLARYINNLNTKIDLGEIPDGH